MRRRQGLSLAGKTAAKVHHYLRHAGKTTADVGLSYTLPVSPFSVSSTRREA